MSAITSKSTGYRIRSNHRTPFSERLVSIGLTEDTFKFFCKVFVVSYGAYYRKCDTWFHVKKPPKLSKYYIAKHLQQECIIGRTMPEVTNYFVIDLDARSCGLPMQERSQAVQKIFGPALAIRSSTSGGVHLYYFLRTQFESGYLSRLLGIILHKGGIKPERACIETFPGLIHQLRLPLGEGSELLDADSLVPLGLNLSDSLDYIRKYLARNRILPNVILHRIIDEKNPKVFPDVVETTSLPPTRKPITYDVSVYPDRIKRILDTPLQYGQRHQAFMALIPYYVNKGYDDSEIVFKLIRFMNKPEQRSKDWESNKQAVIRNIKALLKNFRGKSRTILPPKLGLTEEEGNWILDQTLPLMQSGKYGHRAYYLQIFLFHLLLIFKKSGTRELSLSQKFLLKIEGTSKKRLASQVHFLREKRILILVERRNRVRHTCRKYRLNYVFATTGTSFVSFQDYLRNSVSQERLASLYTRHLLTLICTHD